MIDWEKRYDAIMHEGNPVATVQPGPGGVDWDWVISQRSFSVKFNAMYDLLKEMGEKIADLDEIIDDKKE